MKNIFFALVIFYSQSFAQKIAIDATLGSHYNFQNGLMGSNITASVALNSNEKDRIQLLAIINFYNESDKTKSYGNSLADGRGTHQYSFSKGFGVEYFFDKSRKISISGSILHTNVVFNQKFVSGNTARETTSNDNFIGFMPNLHYYYLIPKSLVYFKANAGSLISINTISPSIQFGLGYSIK